MVSTHAAASWKSFIDAEYEKFKRRLENNSRQTNVAELAQEKSILQDAMRREIEMMINHHIVIETLV